MRVQCKLRFKLCRKREISRQVGRNMENAPQIDKKKDAKEKVEGRDF